MTKNNLDDEFSEEKFIETFNRFNVISIHGTLEADNNVNEISFGCEEDYAIEMCERFEEKYNKKLNYEMKDGLCYFSYNKK